MEQILIKINTRGIIIKSCLYFSNGGTKTERSGGCRLVRND